MNRATRQAVQQRGRQRCEYCQMPEECDPDLSFHVDHIIAQQHRGPTVLENLAWACFSCSTRKGPNVSSASPETGELIPLFNPRKDYWNDHFRWSGSKLEGLTLVGEATIHVLGINLPHRVELRRALIEEGVFPPSD